MWFGEGFDYQGTSADWWLLETSGLPYGLTGDMIGACPPNRWLGMVFGASALNLSDLVFSPRLPRRHPGMAERLTDINFSPSGPNSTEGVVELWEFWATFGIAEAEMIGA